MRRFTGATDRRAATDARDRAANDRFSVYETLLSLPTLLDGADLPDGVIELLIEDLFINPAPPE